MIQIMINFQDEKKYCENLHTLKFSYLFKIDFFKCDILKQLIYAFLITSCKDLFIFKNHMKK
jgi:hypothetical protein